MGGQGKEDFIEKRAKKCKQRHSSQMRNIDQLKGKISGNLGNIYQSKGEVRYFLSTSKNIETH